MKLDAVFDALADPHRRTLLDTLFMRDGQTLSELCEYLPMTRFGVMKHLNLLEGAGLITTRKIGREKYHYLNPVPIQMVYDRWVGKYAQPWTQALTGLKSALENETMTQQQPRIFEIFIRTTPERLWQALTDGEVTQGYYFGSRVQSTWEVGAAYHYPNPAGGNYVEGEVLEIDPPRRLVATFRPVFDPYTDDFAPSTVTWQIEPMGRACKLTLTHEGLNIDDPLTQGLITGWAQILSGLKTLLETGEPLVMEPITP